MFQELMPLLAQRMLLLTLSRVSDEKICVNVIPKPLKSDQRDDENALTTPLAVTGTPKELDEQLPSQLVELVRTHLELSSTLKSAKEQMEAAAKAAREAARKSTSTKSHSARGSGATPSSTQGQAKDETKDRSDDSEPSPEGAHVEDAGVGTADLGASSTGSLFDVETEGDH
jgi:PRTRC genetic system protein E